MKKKVLVLMGPNLNMVGVREKSIYGEESAESIKLQILTYAEKLGYVCEVFQSNWEGALVDKIHEARDIFDKLCENNWNWAEPGILFWNNIENYNLLSNNPDFEYAGTNPCKHLCRA